MTPSFHEPFHEAPVPMPAERSTGFVFAAVAVIAAILWRTSPSVAGPALMIAVWLAVVAVLKPSILAPLNRAWFQFGLALNKVISPVVMFVIFTVTIVPFGLVMQRFRDPLRKQRGTKQASYWIDRPAASKTASMSRQF